jgi:four helix bundle protein
MKKSIIQEKSFDFSLKIINLYKQLLSEKEFVISKQLLRCGTSIGANVEEAGAAQTKKDFILKMSIASKEAREASYWLKLLAVSKLTQYDFVALNADIKDLINILTAIVKTTQQSLQK